MSKQCLGFGLALVLLVGVAGCAPQPQDKTPLRALMAGSLLIPFDHLETAFEQAHPNVDVLMEGHGSVQVIRHVTELHHLVDVVASADHALIPALMYTTTNEETGRPYADWHVEFAANKLTLAYTERSAYADEVNADNWYEVIARPGVRLGLADPRFDAAGYRGLMALQLAEIYYDDHTIFDNAIYGRFESPIRVRKEGEQWFILVPEIVQPKKDSGIVLRGGSIQLIALLESGDVDYAFEYESVGQQHGFRFVSLPDEIGMGREDLASTYGQVVVKLDFQRFASVRPEFPGEYIKYGVTVPTNAPHPDLAAEFVAFLLGPEGQKVMAADHHPLIQPPRLHHQDRAPEAVRALCVPIP